MLLPHWALLLCSSIVEKTSSYLLCCIVPRHGNISALEKRVQQHVVGLFEVFKIKIKPFVCVLFSPLFYTIFNFHINLGPWMKDCLYFDWSHSCGFLLNPCIEVQRKKAILPQNPSLSIRNKNHINNSIDCAQSKQGWVSVCA